MHTTSHSDASEQFETRGGTHDGELAGVEHIAEEDVKCLQPLHITAAAVQQLEDVRVFECRLEHVQRVMQR